MSAEQCRDLAFPRGAIDFLFLLLASLAGIKIYTAMFIKKSRCRKVLGLFLSSVNKVLQYLLKSDLRNLQSGYCTFLGKGVGGESKQVVPVH